MLVSPYSLPFALFSSQSSPLCPFPCPLLPLSSFSSPSCPFLPPLLPLLPLPFPLPSTPLPRPGTLCDFHDECGDTYYAENDGLTYHFLVRRLYRQYTEDVSKQQSCVLLYTVYGDQ